MAENDQFKVAVSAYEQVKLTIDALKAEHADIVVKIAESETKLADLPMAYIPLDDLKNGILDLVDAAGERYAEKKIRSAISALATGQTSNSMVAGFDLGSIGKPMRYKGITAAIDGSDPISGRAQLLTYGNASFDDQAVYFLFSQLIREGLRTMMDRMSPAEFGYDKIHPNKIGSTRAERRRAIDDLEKQLSDLRDRKSEIEQKLRALGTTIPAYPKGM